MARGKDRRLGVHVSIAGGPTEGLGRAHALGCGTAQIFTHNPRAWKVAPLRVDEAARFGQAMEALDIRPVFAHASYLINIASQDEAIRIKSVGLLRTEMLRASELGVHYVVLHPGVAHDAEGRGRAARSLLEVLGSEEFSAGLLLENTAARRGDVAAEIPAIAHLQDMAHGLTAGICLDSCHAFAAGYDIRRPGGLRKLSGQIRRHVGIERLKLIHLNDSRGASGAHVDRHEHLGRGEIGAAGLRAFVRHGPFKGVPVVLETPKRDEADDAENLALAAGYMGIRLR